VRAFQRSRIARQTVSPARPRHPACGIVPGNPSWFFLAGEIADGNAAWPAMNIEHFALQVSDPVAMADWYVKHLGFSIARSSGEPVNARFLLARNGASMLEIYRNPKASVPDYKSIDPLHLHIAFYSEDPAADRDRLVNAGATVVDDLTKTPGGDELVMLRDPWSTAIQLVRRTQPMLKA
jgi:catechol 2,3-dioxygenase-like lactoylglutathione lyase family enzyme